MSTRQDKLAAAWVEEVAEFGDLKACRPTTHRINVLMRRRNKWVSDDEREQTDIEALVEWLFVLSRSKQELTSFFRASMDEWECMIDEFMAELSEDVLGAWQEFFEGVMQEIQTGVVEDAERGKPPKTEEPNHVS